MSARITDSVNFFEPIVTSGVEAQAGVGRPGTDKMQSEKRQHRYKKVFRSDSFPTQ
jgi:hypothetical protein